MKKSLEPGLFLIKKENLRLKEENSKLKARVENIEINLRESKLFELLFPVVVASMLTVCGYAFLFFFEQLCEFIHERIDILELPVDGSEADICDFVDALELLHRELADIDGCHLAVE